MTKLNKITYFIISLIFFVFFDIYFSNLILNILRFTNSDNPIFSLTFVQNTGAAFSILENASSFLIIFAAVAVIIVLVYSIRNIEKFSAFAGFWTAMLVSGICCNMYERIVFGYVRDFIKLNFIEFPIFNISDIFINIGVLAIIIIILKNKYLRK